MSPQPLLDCLAPGQMLPRGQGGGSRGRCYQDKKAGRQASCQRVAGALWVGPEVGGGRGGTRDEHLGRRTLLTAHLPKLMARADHAERTLYSPGRTPSLLLKRGLNPGW